MFRGEAFKPDATFADSGTDGRMTLAGTVNKTGILLVLCLITASFTWNIFFRSGDPAAVTGLLWIGLIGGLVLALITIFKRQWAGITAPLYALAEGLALGGISAMFEAQYPRHRDTGDGPDLWHSGDIAACLQEWIDQTDRKLPADDRCRHRRNRRFIPGQFCYGFFRVQYRLHSQQTVYLVSASVFLWWPSLRSVWCWILTS